MDITALGDGSFGVAAMRLGGWKPVWRKGIGLEVGPSDRPLNVTTNRGVFVEVVNEAGEVVEQGGDGEWFYVSPSDEVRLLRYKTLPDPALTPAQLNKARKTVTRYLVSDMPYNLSIPGTLVGVIKWMEEQLAAIPEASRKNASFRFDTSMEYGETYPNVEITYSEKETDEEVIRRVQIERERDELTEIGERARLADLQAKYA